MLYTNLSINIQTLLKLSNPALVAFVNEIDQKLWLTVTNSTMDCITRNTALIKTKMHSVKGLNEDVDKLIIQVFEEHNSIRYLKYMMNYWYTKYKVDLDYTPYNDYKAFEYRFHEVVDHRTGYGGVSLYIAGKSRAIKNMVLIGKFKTMTELEAVKSRGIEKCLKEIVD